MRRWRNSMLLSAFLAWRAFVQARKDSGPPSTGSESSEDAGEEDEEQGGEEEEQGNGEQGERKEERDDEQWGTTGASREVSVSPRPRKRGRGRPRKHRQRRRGRPSAAEAAEAESSKDATGSATSGGGDEVEATSNQDTASSTSETASPRKGRGRMKRRNSTLQAAVAELLSHPRRRNGTAAPTTTKHVRCLGRGQGQGQRPMQPLSRGSGYPSLTNGAAHALHHANNLPSFSLSSFSFLLSSCHPRSPSTIPPPSFTACSPVLPAFVRPLACCAASDEDGG